MRRAGRNQHVLCGAQQPFDPHGEPALYPAHQRFQQEAGQSPFGGRPIPRALQSVPRTRIAFAKRPQATPAMALGIADRVWTLGELIDAALAVATPDPTETAPERRRKFRVIEGGRQ